MLKESLTIIIYESERLGKLIDDLLLLARSQEKHYRMEKIDIINLLRQIIKESENLHPNLKLLVPVNMKLQIYGDEEAVKRIFINLIDNALKAGSNQEEVIVKLEHKIKNIEIFIIDNGAGIASDHIPHLFERFYRVDSARDRNKGGTGLGLAIVKELAEIHGGKINVCSTVGKGSVFTVNLPLIENVQSRFMPNEIIFH